MGFVGMDARYLQYCMGPPLEFELSEEEESVTYRWAWSNPTTGAEIFGLEANPRMMVGSYHAHDEALGGYCEFRFLLRDGQVASFDVTGRTNEKLNADGECLKRIRPCLQEER